MPTAVGSTPPSERRCRAGAACPRRMWDHGGGAVGYRTMLGDAQAVEKARAVTHLDGTADLLDVGSTLRAR